MTFYLRLQTLGGVLQPQQEPEQLNFDLCCRSVSFLSLCEESYYEEFGLRIVGSRLGYGPRNLSRQLKTVGQVWAGHRLFCLYLLGLGPAISVGRVLFHAAGAGVSVVVLSILVCDVLSHSRGLPWSRSGSMVVIEKLGRQILGDQSLHLFGVFRKDCFLLKLPVDDIFSTVT